MDVSAIIVLVITLISSVVGVPVIQWLKSKLNLADNAARLLAIAVSFLLSIAAVFFGGEFAGVEVNLETIGAMWAAVYALAVTYYGFLNNGTGMISRVLGIGKSPTDPVG